MRNIYRKYYRVTDGPLVDAVQAAKEINVAAHKAYVEILQEIGATAYCHRDGKLTGIRFKEEPDKYLFKKQKVRDGWYPKQNCKEGRELAARIKAVKTASVQGCLKTVGLCGTAPLIFGSDRAYYVTLIFIPDTPPVIYVSVPWFDADPQEIEQYKKDREAKTHFNHSLDFVSTWNSTPHMIPVKEWEVQRHIDAWNSKVEEAA